VIISLKTYPMKPMFCVNQRKKRKKETLWELFFQKYLLTPN
jgi:hypothetical protein